MIIFMINGIGGLIFPLILDILMRFLGLILICRTPILAKCGGEAQHLEKLGIWSSPGLSNV